jgi:predicted nucleic acid-binding protein
VPKSGEGVTYLDSSALVKLVVDEEESVALRKALAGAAARTSSNIARVEMVRAVRGKGPEAVANARAILDGIELIQLDDELLDLAGDLEGPLRSLDGIHLAAALELGEELEAVVTYDRQMARAAETLGLRVVAPV